MGTDTIAAVATPIGRGGIGIIKISGDDAVAIAESVFQRSADSSRRRRRPAISPSLSRSYRRFRARKGSGRSFGRGDVGAPHLHQREYC